MIGVMAISSHPTFTVLLGYKLGHHRLERRHLERRRLEHRRLPHAAPGMPPTPRARLCLESTAASSAAASCAAASSAAALCTAAIASRPRYSMETLNGAPEGASARSRSPSRSPEAAPQHPYTRRSAPSPPAGCLLCCLRSCHPACWATPGWVIRFASAFTRSSLLALAVSASVSTHLDVLRRWARRCPGLLLRPRCR